MAEPSLTGLPMPAHRTIRTIRASVNPHSRRTVSGTDRDHLRAVLCSARQMGQSIGAGAAGRIGDRSRRFPRGTAQRTHLARSGRIIPCNPAKRTSTHRLCH
jgi:hypothetical protein